MICSPELLHSETEKIKEILVGNGYPLELIKKKVTMTTVGSLIVCTGEFSCES